MIKNIQQFWIIPVLLSIFISLNFFWSKPLVPGFDSPFYLTEIRDFSKAFPNPLTYQHLDRYLTIAFPSVLSQVFGFDPVTSYRITISLIYVLLAYAVFVLMKNITKRDSVAALLSASVVISPLMLTYSSMLFANFSGFLILFSFFAIETAENFKYKKIVLGIILGLIFYIHNFSTVSIGLIIAFYYLLKLIFTKDVKVLKEGIVVFLIAAIVGFVGLSRYLNIDLSFPKKENTTSVTSISTVRVTLPVGQPVLLGDEKERIVASLKEDTGKYWLYLFPLLFVSLGFIERKEFSKNKNQFLLPLAILIPSLVLTLQPLYHLNFLPERFVSFVCLSTYFFYIAVISLPIFKKYLLPLAILPLFLNYMASDSLILNKGYRSFSAEEISVYKTANLIMQKDGVVIMASDHGYWGRYMLEGHQIITGESFISCGTITDEKTYGKTSFIIGKLLGEKDSTIGTNLVAELKSIFPDKMLYVLTDTSLSCGHGRVLKEINTVKQLLQQSNWYLYEII
jgi:hypothetical protein